jgi:hypothetical protein
MDAYADEIFEKQLQDGDIDDDDEDDFLDDDGTGSYLFQY